MNSNSGSADATNAYRVSHPASDMILQFRSMDEADARAIWAWQYEPPYDFYNASGSLEIGVRTLLDPGNAYYAIVNEQNNLIAFCCYGQDAQVPGGNYHTEALDVGCGLRPDLTGQGLGLVIVHACLTFARAQFAPPAFRVTVAAFNLRALSVWRKAGFDAVQSFQSRTTSREFVILTYAASCRSNMKPLNP